jgi:hypothetical protein
MAKNALSANLSRVKKGVIVGTAQLATDREWADCTEQCGEAMCAAVDRLPVAECLDRSDPHSA